jgi:hypothetical protein
MRTVLKVFGGGAKLIGGLALSLPQLALMRRRAAAAFRREMRQQGLDEAVIDELTKVYLDMGAQLSDWKNWVE